MLDKEAKLFKKSKAMSVGRPLPMSTQPFTGTFSFRNKKNATWGTNLNLGETWCKSDIW